MNEDYSKVPIEIFISYAHADQELFNSFLNFLKPIKRRAHMKVWHDKLLVGGDAWDESIISQLDSADIGLLLVTQNFIASDYIFEKELKTFLEKYERNEIRIVPVILRASTWQQEEFSRFQVLPNPPKPLSEWATPDQAFTNIINGLEKSILKTQKEKVARPVGAFLHAAVKGISE